MMTFWLLALALPLLVCSAPTYVRLLPQDCHEIFRGGESRSGVYTIYPDEDSPVQVYCDMGSKKSSKRGWTVFQRRMDGTTNFYRNWDQYTNGFGNASAEYWLGLETLNTMMSNNRYELRVDFGEGFDGIKVFAEYTQSSVGPMDSDYTLQIGGFIDGGAGDSLSYHNNLRFATFDHGNPHNCPIYYLSGFWYDTCLLTNPNGMYLWEVDYINYGRGVCWYTWRGLEYNLKSITMKIIPGP